MSRICQYCHKPHPSGTSCPGEDVYSDEEEAELEPHDADEMLHTRQDAGQSSSHQTSGEPPGSEDGDVEKWENEHDPLGAGKSGC